MKSECVLLAIASLAAVGTLHGQEDTVRQTSANQESWYNQELPRDAEPKKDSVELTFGQLPDRIRNVIESRKEYSGWQNGRIYFDKINRLYKLYIPGATNTRMFAIDPEGYSISFRSTKNR